ISATSGCGRPPTAANTGLRSVPTCRVPIRRCLPISMRRPSPTTCTRARAAVYSIGSSPLHAKLLWTGTDDGLVWRTDDAGAHWSNVTPKQLGAWSKVGSISPSHFDQDTTFASVDRHRLDDRKPYIYRTTDGGKTWTAIVDGIPDGDFVDVVREDPVKRGLLYAGTDFGIFVSFDNGDHWHSLQQNLPAVS